MYFHGYLHHRLKGVHFYRHHILSSSIIPIQTALVCDCKMANCTKDEYEMILIQCLLPFVCLGILVLPSLLLQSFILAVNIIDWMKGRPMKDTDKLIILNELSKLCFHTASLLYFLAMFNFPESSSLFLISLEVVINFSAFFSIYVSTMHVIFIYFKMFTFHNVFLRLKTIALRKVAYLIVASVLVSLAFSFTQLLTYTIQVFRSSIQIFILHYKRKPIDVLYFHLLWNMLPILMNFLPSFLLIISLVLHMVRMNNCGNVTSSTDAYRRTIRFTCLCILIWVIHIVTYIEGVYMWFFGPWYLFIMNSIPCLHSVLLIYAATKLRNQFFRIVHCGADYVFNRKVPGPHSREPMEVTAL